MNINNLKFEIIGNIVKAFGKIVVTVVVIKGVEIGLDYAVTKLSPKIDEIKKNWKKKKFTEGATEEVAQ